jgi:hypothetical protein
VVNSTQGRVVRAYKKKHSLNRQKFFFMQNLHVCNELHSTFAWLAFPLLKGRPNPGKGIPDSEPNPKI